MSIPRTVLSIIVLVIATLVVWGTGFSQQYEKPRHFADAQLFSLRKVIEAYYLDTGELPKTLGDLIANSRLAKWNGPYAKPENILGQNGQPIVYDVGTGSNFTLTTVDRDRNRISRSSQD